MENARLMNETHEALEQPILRPRRACRLNEPHEFIPFAVRQPHGVVVLADADAFIGNLDLRAVLAFFA